MTSLALLASWRETHFGHWGFVSDFRDGTGQQASVCDGVVELRISCFLCHVSWLCDQISWAPVHLSCRAERSAVETSGIECGGPLGLGQTPRLRSG